MKTREMKEAMVKEVIAEMEDAKFWHSEWMNADIGDQDSIDSCKALMDEAKARASQSLNLMVVFGWMTDEQRMEVYRDMLAEIYA